MLKGFLSIKLVCLVLVTCSVSISSLAKNHHESTLETCSHSGAGNGVCEPNDLEPLVIPVLETDDSATEVIFNTPPPLVVEVRSDLEGQAICTAFAATGPHPNGLSYISYLSNAPPALVVSNSKEWMFIGLVVSVNGDDHYCYMSRANSHAFAP